MKKAKMRSIGCIVLLMICMFSVSVKAYAQENVPQIDGSYLTHDDESIGYDTKITRGDDLLTGYSKCVKLANGNLYVGGTTIAAHNVDRIGLAVQVERAREGDDSWVAYDSWILFEENTDRISSNKELEAEGGYYYRVYCIHSAGEDISDSFTDGIYFEE